MRIAHINLIFSKRNMAGVDKKLIDEAESMHKKGIDFYVLNREKNIYSNYINYSTFAHKTELFFSVNS